MLLQASHGVVIAICSISRYILETVQTSAKVTIECEYEAICDLSNGVISNDFERLITRVLCKGEYFKRSICPVTDNSFT